MVISKLFTIVGRNLRIYSNLKLFSLIIIFGPLIMMLIIGASLQDTSLKNVNAGVFSSEEESFRNDFINLLKEKSFKTNIEDSLETCKKNVIEEKNQVCIHLKKNQLNLESVSSEYESYDVDIYVDFSKQRVVWGIIGSIQNIVEKESYSARRVLIDDVKRDATSLTEKISSVETKLNSAIIRVGTLENSLRQIEAKNLENENEIDSLQLTIGDSKRSLEEIQESGILIEPYASDLSEAIIVLNTIDSSLENVKIRPSEEKIGSLISSVGNIKTEMLNIKNSLSSLNFELKNFRDLNIDRLADPIILSYYSASDSQRESNIEGGLGSLDYLFPSFLIFFLLFDSILLSTIITIKERSSNAYIRNITSKNSGAVFIIGTLLTVLILIFIQISVVIFIASFFLNLNILSNIFSLIPIIIVSTIIFALIGIIIGYFSNSYETAIIISISISLLFLIFSSIITPTETLPKLFSEIVKLSPLTLLETKLRIALIFNSFFRPSVLEIISLSSVFLLSSFLIGIFYKKSKEKEI